METGPLCSFCSLPLGQKWGSDFNINLQCQFTRLKSAGDDGCLRCGCITEAIRAIAPLIDQDIMVDIRIIRCEVIVSGHLYNKRLVIFNAQKCKY
jgi:hypothetical protein